VWKVSECDADLPTALVFHDSMMPDQFFSENFRRVVYRHKQDLDVLLVAAEGPDVVVQQLSTVEGPPPAPLAGAIPLATRIRTWSKAIPLGDAPLALSSKRAEPEERLTVVHGQIDATRDGVLSLSDGRGARLERRLHPGRNPFRFHLRESPAGASLQASCPCLIQSLEMNGYRKTPVSEQQLWDLPGQSISVDLARLRPGPSTSLQRAGLDALIVEAEVSPQVLLPDVPQLDASAALVLKICLDARVDTRIAIDYTSDSGELSEQNKALQPLVAGRNTAYFQLWAPRGIGRVRLSPGLEGGTYVIHSMQMRIVAMNEVL
jgi:hypothetical protein